MSPPNVPPVNGQPPFGQPGGINPSPLALQQLAYQSICQQLATLSMTPRMNYSIDGVAANWDDHYDHLMRQKESFEKTPGVAPEIMDPFVINQLVNCRWGNGWGGRW